MCVSSRTPRDGVVFYHPVCLCRSIPRTQPAAPSLHLRLPPPARPRLFQVSSGPQAPLLYMQPQGHPSFKEACRQAGRFSQPLTVVPPKSPHKRSRWEVVPTFLRREEGCVSHQAPWLPLSPGRATLTGCWSGHLFFKRKMQNVAVVWKGSCW